MSQKGFAGIIIIIVVLILAGLGGAYYFGKASNKSPQYSFGVAEPDAKNLNDQSKKVIEEKAVSTATSDSSVANWKTYSNNELGFSVEYPSNWATEDIYDRSGKLYGKGLKGTEGEIRMVWGSGFGGGCDQESHVNVQIQGETLDSCHFINSNGTEDWKGLSKSFSNMSLLVQATANTPSSTNRAIILKILSTFKFSDQNKCGSCPQFMPPAPDFCKGGTIVSGGKNECGCQMSPICKK